MFLNKHYIQEETVMCHSVRNTRSPQNYISSLMWITLKVCFKYWHYSQQMHLINRICRRCIHVNNSFVKFKHYMYIPWCDNIQIFQKSATVWNTHLVHSPWLFGNARPTVCEQLYPCPSDGKRGSLDEINPP